MAYTLEEFREMMEDSRCSSELSRNAKLNFDGYCVDCYRELFLLETPKKKHLDRYDLLKK